jgi:hypothetical protein
VNLKPWIAAAAGLGLGLALGLYFTWNISPVEYVDTAPASLRQDFKEEYLLVIAAAYAATGDLDRAKARLELFPDPDHATTLAALAQQRLAAGLPVSETNPLAILASDLTQGSRVETTSPTTQPGTSSPAESPLPTEREPVASTPSVRSSPTPGSPFRLVSKDEVCDSRLPAPLIQVEIVDAAGQPVAGTRVLVIWDSGQDTFYTGLKPDLGLGYADFTMTEGVLYSLQLGETSLPVSDLIAFECQGESGETFLGSWLLKFQQPSSGP